jgi:hypothetical protein
MTRHGRRREPRIEDPQTYRRLEVCLRTAAEYLGMDCRTVRRRILDGYLSARLDGKVYRISVASLVTYRQRHSVEGIDAA